MACDLLSDALTLVRLTGALIFEVDLEGTWGVAGHPTLEKFAPLLPRGTTQIIAFHIVLNGRCWIRHAPDDWFELRAGHAVVITHGDPHDICDRPGRATIPFSSLLEQRNLLDVRRVEFRNGPGESAQLMCGFLGCDRRAFDPLCGSLPPVFDVELGTRVETLVRYALANALDDSPGAAGLRGRLAELLFLSALRQYMRDLPADATGWLAGLRDPLVGRTLQAMHAQPCRRWSVDQLAVAVASSRSVLAERFRAVIGEPPMHYLTRLRMQLAARRLGEGQYSIARVADEVGYDSSAAFQRAFKRCFGVPPAAWRRHNTGPRQVPAD
ncbi:MAG TPA: AraC family transcriptional regulator [Rhodanobacteraceae bacterium]|jgi:AraC-like DNA-binding protein|nr:AraC family transcriptional regulator [Rhodanobacteraceae bacterium]